MLVNGCICQGPDSKVHGANMGPTWVLSAPDGPHVGPMNVAIRGANSLINFSQAWWKGNWKAMVTSWYWKTFHIISHLKGESISHWLIHIMKVQWWGPSIFSLLLMLTFCWTNISIAGDFRCHYPRDITIMLRMYLCCSWNLIKFANNLNWLKSADQWI